MDPVRATIAYHERTKHHPHRYAPGPDHLDWASQPDPFRTYAGAPRVELPLAADSVTTRYADLYRPGAVRAAPLSLTSVSVLFELGLGLSTWKQFRGERWALRCNPSSGNLHPTEGYLIAWDVPGLAAGVHHYVSRDHTLEHRCRLDPHAAATLGRHLPPGTLLVGLTSIHWREAWKYGERAFRYCEQDTGHAIGSVRYAAASLGWTAALAEGLADGQVAALLGVDREMDYPDASPADREHPGPLLVLDTRGSDARTAAAPLARVAPQVASLLRSGVWSGRANTLSASTVDWPAIDEVARATSQGIPPPPSLPHRPLEDPPLGPAAVDVAAATLIRQRRSAVSLDGKTAIDAPVFLAMLDCVLPRRAVVPWDVLEGVPRIHLLLFVHRVRGLDPGLYLLARSPAALAPLSASIRREFDWTAAPGRPDHLPLTVLTTGDVRHAAQLASCHQEIAADGSFAVAMLGDLEPALRELGTHAYRRLHWEAGLVGHVLYLESEAAGIRGTGMGCFFDDVVHQILGIEDHSLQSIYHFTTGGPVEDERLTTLPPYAHLGQSRTGH